VFDADERVESSTGALWQWLLVAAGAVGADPASDAVYGGLLLAWPAADRGLRADPPTGTDPARLEAARRALRCGALAELRAATRDPLTPGRFPRNLAGSWERTAFRFPNLPLTAERKVCGR
jgi:hypothetical protein